ncbi:expressed tetratricopeptide repeat protein [Nitzschia inconspicua]|uniref:Expressed tetratricopeptide repeat protein n=1 Tax=Nitzschia inconspicua TaxID=303405 RepID=A0A9K3Q4B7_9STRA|nr:expressed tetratricopeptide repeat protein [Nitzschia inconspicua]
MSKQLPACQGTPSPQSQSDIGSTSTSIQEFARRLYCPDPEVKRTVAGIPESVSTLSHIPWQLQYGNDDVSLAAESVQVNPGNDVRQSLCFLPFSYLDLRRQQNVEFANQKCQEALEASLLDHSTAKSLFQQALELVPDHIDSLLGYGKLLVRIGHLEKATLAFRDVLEVDAANEIAHRYLKSLDETQKQERQKRQSNVLVLSTKQVKALDMRDSSAFQDALLERSLAMDDDNGKDAMDDEGRCDRDGHDDASTDKDERRSKRRHRDKKERHSKKRKRKKDKKKRSKREKRSRRRSYSSDDSSYTSSR